MLNKKFLLKASSLTLALLTGCGGGGSNTSSASNQLTGSVLDGYIEGATVCLDTNNSGTCDAGEPSTKTSSDGKFKLDIGSASATGQNLVVDIPSTAKDSDDNGKTLAEAGKSAYTMATTADQPSVITPLTTLVVGKIKTDGITLAAAKTKVLKELGLPEDTNLHEDHIQNGNDFLHSLSRETSARLQKVQSDYEALPDSTKPKDKLAHFASELKSADEQLGTLVKSSLLTNIPASISNIADGKLIIYKMRSVKGELINASAMLFTPKSPPSATGGWPVLVFGYGTTGIDSSCAPSRTFQAGGGFDYATFLKTALNMGAAVVVPDYEGRGPLNEGIPNAHPYLHLSSAGQSMVLSVVAAKKTLGSQLSGMWAAVGHSQGGHAALAAGQFSGLAQSLDSSLNYKGAVAVAPASNLVPALNSMLQNIAQAPRDQASFYQLGTLNFYASYLVQGSSFTNDPINPKTVFGARMQEVHKKANTCFGPYSVSIFTDINAFAQTGGAANAYTGVIADEINKPAVSSALKAMEPGTVKIPGKTLIVQGASDTTVLPAASDALQKLMKLKGSDLSYQLFTDSNGIPADHSGVLSIPQAQQAISNHLQTLFTPTQ